MLKRLMLLVVMAAAPLARAEAANFAVITHPPTMLNIFVLVFAVASTLGAARVLAQLRGGQLGKSWQMFVAGFAVMALCALAALADSFELLMVPSFVVPGGLAVMSGLFLYGVTQAKRILG